MNWKDNTRSDANDPQTYAILGACMAVHNELGHGFFEGVYQDALEIELSRQNIPYFREQRLNIFYAGEQLRSYYEADFVCYESVVVELKALSAIDSPHIAQVINALKATGYQRGLLVNFGTPRLEYKRIIWSADNETKLPPEEL